MDSPRLGARKLAAIAFTDIAGFTALAQSDEAQAIRLLEQHRAIVRRIVPQHAGRIVKTMGDGFLLQFDSALGAVQCAIEIQTELKSWSEASSDSLAMRIGVHVGDVVEDGEDILGDGVNVASRIEPLAPRGGICVSDDVERQVRNKLPYGLIELGKQSLKNVAVPMAVFAVDLPWLGLKKQTRRRISKAWIFASVALAVVIAAVWSFQKWPKALMPNGRAATLVEQAKRLIDSPLAQRSDYVTAKQMCAEAIALDSLSADAHAVYSRASWSLVSQYFDLTPGATEKAQAESERALQLDPNSVEAGLAASNYDDYKTAIVRLEKLFAQNKSDRRIVWQLLQFLASPTNSQKFQRLRNQSLETFGDDPLVWLCSAYIFGDDPEKYPEWKACFQRSLKAGPSKEGFLSIFYSVTLSEGDPKSGLAYLDAAPKTLMAEFREPRCLVNLYLRRPEQVLDAAKGWTIDFDDRGGLFLNSRGYYAGMAHLLAGRKEAAKFEFERYLKALEQRQVAGLSPFADSWFAEIRAEVCAALGRRKEAETWLARWKELSGSKSYSDYRELNVLMLLDRKEDVIALCQKKIDKSNSLWPNYLNLVRNSFLFDSVRNDPRMKKVIDRGTGWLKAILARKPGPI